MLDIFYNNFRIYFVFSEKMINFATISPFSTVLRKTFNSVVHSVTSFVKRGYGLQDN